MEEMSDRLSHPFFSRLLLQARTTHERREFRDGSHQDMGPPRSVERLSQEIGRRGKILKQVFHKPWREVEMEGEVGDDEGGELVRKSSGETSPLSRHIVVLGSYQINSPLHKKNQ